MTGPSKTLEAAIHYVKTGDTGALKELKQDTDAAASAGKKMGLVWTEAASAFALVERGVLVVKGAFDTAIKASAEQERSIATVNAALAAHGNFSDAASKKIQAYAGVLQQTVNVADDVALSVAAQIEGLTHLSGDAIPDAMKATVQLAELTRMDLNSAGMLVAKTLEGNVAILKRYGITLEEGGTQQEILARLISETSAGMDIALAKTETYEGKQTALNLSWGEFNEAVGNYITQGPVAVDLLDETRSVVDDMTQSFIDGLPAMQKWFAEFQVGATKAFTFGTPWEVMTGNDIVSRMQKQFPKMSTDEIKGLLRQTMSQSADEIRSSATGFVPYMNRTPSIFNEPVTPRGGGNGGERPKARGPREITWADMQSNASDWLGPWRDAYQFSRGNRMERESLLSTLGGMEALPTPWDKRSPQSRVGSGYRTRPTFGQTTTSNGGDGSSKDESEAALMDYAASIVIAASQGGGRAAGQAAIQGGLSMIAANNPGLAIPLAIASAFVPGLFKEHERKPAEIWNMRLTNPEDITGPITGAIQQQNRLLAGIIMGGGRQSLDDRLALQQNGHFGVGRN